MSDEPRIQLMGKWVRKLGFIPGGYIRLRVKKNEIVIKNMDIKKVIE